MTLLDLATPRGQTKIYIAASSAHGRDVWSNVGKHVASVEVIEIPPAYVNKPPYFTEPLFKKVLFFTEFQVQDLI